MQSVRTAPVREREWSGELWVRDLLRIGTSYGQLVYLAGLRNPNTGRYEYYGATGNSSAEANRGLKRHHEDIFRQWITYPLEKKKADIELYISGLDQVDKAELIDAWAARLPGLKHYDAQGVLREFSESLLAELDYLLATRVGVRAQRAMLDEVARGAYRLETFTGADVGLAAVILRRYPNLEIGLADASIVVLAERYDVWDVLTLDHRHFNALRGPGRRRFRLLPSA